jgi:hypothetical protein
VGETRLVCLRGDPLNFNDYSGGGQFLFSRPSSLSGVELVLLHLSSVNCSSNEEIYHEIGSK